MSKRILILVAFILISGPTACRPSGPTFTEIKGFRSDTNETIRKFLSDTWSRPGRKVAVFDGDGTVLGQVPHYLADECLYAQAARKPNQKPDVIARMRNWSNVSIPYVKHRVFFLEGETLENVRRMGEECYDRDYKGKMYPPMKQLIALLMKNNFEVWVITASPEGMYQGFISRELGIPITNVVGVKSVVHGGRLTSQIVEPVPQDEGKKEAVETFVQADPIFAAGNSRGDREMIESSVGIRMIINPDEHVQTGETESIADYAKRNHWLIEAIHDVEETGFPNVTSGQFKIRKNKAHP